MRHQSVQHFFQNNSKNNITQQNGYILANSGNIYACGYHKGKTMEILMKKYPQKTHVYFFDDNIYNTLDVANHTKGPYNIDSYWWDCYQEYQTGEMQKDKWSEEDFSYHEKFGPLLQQFGITEELRQKRFKHFIINLF